MALIFVAENLMKGVRKRITQLLDYLRNRGAIWELRKEAKNRKKSVNGSLSHEQYGINASSPPLVHGSANNQLA